MAGSSIRSDRTRKHTGGYLAVEDPKIDEVLDLRSGEPIPAHEAIGSDYGKAIALRMALQESIARGSPICVCPLCGIPVYLVSRKEAPRFFFRHQLEDGRCPARTRGDLNEKEINARTYNGAKESQAHFRMKNILAESLRCDPMFSDVKIEAVWKGQDRITWRKPDVRAVYDGIPVAFEIQLSTTFLRVIAERRVFYLREGGLLCWIFKSFDEEQSRLMQDDIFYNNNRNLFLAGEETLKASQAAGKLILDCRWAEPYVEGDRIANRWNGRIATFDEMTIERDRQRVFLYDYDREADALQEVAVDSTLRVEFEAFWLPRDTYGSYDEDVWLRLRSRFRERGIDLPLEPNDGRGPVHMLNALYSAREGRPIGWRFNNLVQVAHNIESGHKRLLRVFRNALAVYGRAEQIKREDRNGKWRRKVDAYKPALATNHPEYESDRRFDDLVAFLFPELRARDGLEVAHH